jgi:MFS family permease
MRALLPVSALLMSVAILLTGNGLQGLLLPIRANLEGFSTIEIALVGSCYFAGFGAGCVLGPRFVKRVGHIRTYTAMTAIAAAVALAHPFVPRPVCWWILRVVSGFCFAVLYMVIESWLNERSDEDTRGFVLSAYMIINLTVITLGQMMLPLHDPKGMELFAVVAILVSLAAVPVALTLSVSPAPIESTKIRIGRLYALSPAGVTTCLAVGLTIGAFWALAPQFAQSSGLTETGIALFMSAAVLGGALGQWPLGRLSDTGDRRKVIILSSILAAATGLLIVTRVFPSEPALFVMAAAWGAFAFPLYSLGVAHTNDHAARDEFVETSSGLLLVYAAGAVGGPFIASLVTTSFGPTLLYGYMLAVHVVLVGFVIWRMTRKSTPPDEEHIRFMEALQASQTVSPVFDAQTQADMESTRQDTEPEPHGTPSRKDLGGKEKLRS